MDGGGREGRPPNAGKAGGGEARAPRSLLQTALPFLTRASYLPRRGRRSSVAVPLQRRLPTFFGSGLTLAFFGTVAVTGLSLGGHLDALRAEHGRFRHVIARAAGFDIERVTITGIAQLTEAEVLAAAGVSNKVSLPFLSVDDARRALVAVPLVRSASVRKLYPNELVVNLVEREPFALWQRQGELFVISADGTVIDEMRDARFAELPLVVGDEANLRSKEYLALIEAAGPLRARIRAGTLVSGRRWTLKMDNGIDVRLPEIGAMSALQRLAKLERESRVLEKDVIAIDLRMSDRVVVRLTEEAAAARTEALKKKPVRGKGVET